VVVHQFPKDQLHQRYNFTATDDFLDKPAARHHANRRRLGSFVSPNGLVFTNDHVASDCISKLGSAQHNYMRDGFYAATQQEEIACPDLEANVLLNVDGEIESLPQTYLYTEEQARAVHVASQGII
jgi:hypothetical protein